MLTIYPAGYCLRFPVSIVNWFGHAKKRKKNCFLLVSWALKSAKTINSMQYYIL